MILIKKYRDTPGEEMEKEFETTLEDQLVNLTKTFVNVKLIVDLLKKGDTVDTYWATYRIKEEPVKEKIKKRIEKEMNNKYLNEKGNDNIHTYLSGFISASRYFELIDIGESNELSFYLQELYAKNRKRIEKRKKSEGGES